MIIIHTSICILYYRNNINDQKNGEEKMTRKTPINRRDGGKTPIIFKLILISPILLILMMFIIDPVITNTDRLVREPITLEKKEDLFFNILESPEIPFNGTHFDLVQGDVLILKAVPFTHFSTESSTYCNTYSTYSYLDEQSSYETECWTSYWDVFNLKMAGMNFSITGGSGFMHTCFNAFCNVTFIVSGNDVSGEPYFYGDRISVRVSEYNWVRWCTGEVNCE